MPQLSQLQKENKHLHKDLEPTLEMTQWVSGRQRPPGTFPWPFRPHPELAVPALEEGLIRHGKPPPHTPPRGCPGRWALPLIPGSSIWDREGASLPLGN